MYGKSSWSSIVKSNIAPEPETSNFPSVAQSSAKQSPTKNEADIKNAENDFPALDNNNPAAKNPTQNDTIANIPPKNKVEVLSAGAANNNNLVKDQLPDDSNNDGEFIEKTKRRPKQDGNDSKPNSGRRRDNNNNRNNNNNNNRNRAQGQSTNNNNNSINSNARSSGSARYSVSSNSKLGSNSEKTFDERLAEEKVKYANRFNDEKSELHFNLVQGDLFSVDEGVSLAHCVSEDFKMGAGIAVEFKRRFARVDELLSQNTRTGGCGYLRDPNRYIFYMVTKRYYNFKPYYNSLESSLKSLLTLCQQFDIKHVAMPKIGAGLDQLDWNIVARIIDDIFSGTNIKITIYEYINPNNNRQDNGRRSNNNRPYKASNNRDSAGPLNQSN